MINRADYYSGGYFLLRKGMLMGAYLGAELGQRAWLEAGPKSLLPEKVVSLSPCWGVLLNITWGWSPGDKQAALDFGIAPEQWDEFAAWCVEGYKHDLDLFSMFYTPAGARRFIQRFALDTSDLCIIGAGLPKAIEEVTWQDEWDENEEVFGIEKQIGRHLALEPGGEVLGFEVVGFEYYSFGCSWLCSDLDTEMHRLFGIRPNQHGLIDTHAEAMQVHQWIAEDEKRGLRAEPIPYGVWLLVSYPPG